MLPPKTSQNGAKSGLRTPSSRVGRNLSKPRCEAWIPLNGWEQGDEADQDVFYLAIDTWARRNAKIKPNAPKGVPSSKIWEPFLCTTVHQCSNIPDYEAFVNVSLCLHKDIEVVEVEQEVKEEKVEKPPSDETKSPAAEKKEGKDVGTEGKGQGNTRSKDAVTVPNEGVSQKGSEGTNVGEGAVETVTNLETENKTVTVEELSQQLASLPNGDAEVKVLQNGYDAEEIHRYNNSHSAPVSRAERRDSLRQRRAGSAKTRYAEDKLRRAAMRNSIKANVTQKVSIPANPVKLSYAHSQNPRAGIFAGDLPMNELVDLLEAEGDSEDTLTTLPPESIKRRTSQERRMLIEEALRDSKKVEYIPKAAHVSIGDLLSSAPKLERRLVNKSRKRDSVYASLMSGEEVTSSAESFAGWPSPRHNGEGGSPSSDTSLPPVVSSNLTREIHTSPSASQVEGRRGEPRGTVNLKTARIPVISYRKPARRENDDTEEVCEVKPAKKNEREDTRYVKYNDSIMSAIEETTVELDSDITHRLLKAALARDKGRVHSADYIRQEKQANVPTTQAASKPGRKRNNEKSQLQAESDRDKDRIVSQVLGRQRVPRRGPPGFRPQSFKTPLQRAVENAHKKIYGQHYYLFYNNSGTQGMDSSEDIRNGAESANGSASGLRTQSASSDIKSAFVWKENLESQLRHKRKATPVTTTVSLGEIHDIRWRSMKQQTNWSSVVEHYVRHSDLSGNDKNRLKTGAAQGNSVCNVSDFRPNFKTDALKTERRA
ncbi:uncharacterized protein [Diadema antillarum]|uniref:uncharacterized protein n=1 Tax=Diadema antillarum TaxID=105358 RepID=UPI003A83B636